MHQYTKLSCYLHNSFIYTVADPGFPIEGGGGMHPLGGCGPPMWALFSKNVCKNERIGSHKGGMCQACPPRSANVYIFWSLCQTHEVLFNIGQIITARICGK